VPGDEINHIAQSDSIDEIAKATAEDKSE